MEDKYYSMVSQMVVLAEDEATRLIKKYPMLIAAGILKGPFALRAIAIALEMKEEENDE